jgi:predicted HicB family RNase H-like nuclease
MAKPRSKLTARRPTSTAAASAAKAFTVQEQRLAVNIPAATHRELKARAAQAGVSIKEYLIDLLRRDGLMVP